MPARPVILTVDDDPGVSRAVARDLRREYGEHHRIVRAESGPAALDALKEIALRGEQVAVILADQRMPRMSGVEFLEQAMDLFPRARRVLLTAYADTEAAITAINVVDLDHYLLKPWDPPEEKLYPVVDSLLAAWRDTPDRPSAPVRIVGHRWSSRSYELRDLVARNQLSYDFLRADEPEGARLLEAAGADPDQLPVVITEDGTALVQPTDAQVIESAGLSTTASEAVYDLAVIGGGPGGLGASVYGGSEGLRTVLIESRATGGQAGTSSRIENYLGFPNGVSGDQLTTRARLQAEKFGTEVLTTRHRDQHGAPRAGARHHLRRRLGDHRARRGAGHRRLVPDARLPGARGAHRAGRVLRRRGHRGELVRRPGRVRRRRRQLGGPGGDELLPAREPGRHARARSVPDGVHVALPDRADRGEPPHRGPHLHRGRRRGRHRAPREADVA